MLDLTHAEYTRPFICGVGALDVKKGASSWNLFHPHRTRALTAEVHFMTLDLKHELV